MDPNSRGWLHKMCEMVEPTDRGLGEIVLPGYEETLYRMVQPSGIMYGHPVREIGQTRLVDLGSDTVSRMKLIFAESLIKTGGLSIENSCHPVSNDQVTEHLVPEIADFFLTMYPGLYQGSATSYLKNPYYLAENLIGKRITIQTSLIKNYLANLFHNSLLFMDVFFFGEWIRGLGSSNSSSLKQDSSRFRLTVLGIMALAASADRKLQKEERAMFEFYTESAGLSSEMKREARLLLSRFGKLSEVDLPDIDSWLIRKYLLEIAILVTLADREFNESEQEFIKELGEKLKFSQDEVAASILAVDGFVLENWEAMHYLLGKSSLEVISGRFRIKLKAFVDKNKHYVVQEIRESKELFHLLGKSRTVTLTNYEKKIVNEQLIDILKTIPAFVIIALPFTFITLPTLLAILPKKAFPSSFQE